MESEGTDGIIPVGTMWMYAGSSAPTGWLLCNGAAVSRTTYADLFAVIGETYGVGDSSTTFNLPDMREVYPVGIGTRSAGVTTHDDFDLGEFKDDQFQGHFHSVKNNTSNVTFTTTAADGSARYAWSSSAATVVAKDAITDSVDGTPRTGTTTRGKGLGLNFIIRW